MTQSALRELVVQPGFNTMTEPDPVQALTTTPTLETFDSETQSVLTAGEEFSLVLGDGFETADVAQGFVHAPCAGLAGAEQLRFLKEHGLRRIVMSRLHGTLAQNAKALGIEIVIAPDTTAAL